MGRAEWQGGQEGSCPKPSTEQTLITDQQPHLCRLPCQLDVRPKDTGHSGWQVFVAQKAVLLCQGSQELPKWGSMRWGDIREMASQAGAHLSLQNTSIYAPLPHPMGDRTALWGTGRTTSSGTRPPGVSVQLLPPPAPELREGTAAMPGQNWPDSQARGGRPRGPSRPGGHGLPFCLLFRAWPRAQAGGRGS